MDCVWLYGHFEGSKRVGWAMKVSPENALAVSSRLIEEVPAEGVGVVAIIVPESRILICL